VEEGQAMSAATLNVPRYRKLLDETVPVAIHSAAEYRRLLSAAQELMEKSDGELSTEEGRLLELLGIVIDEYENRTLPLPKTEPHRMLAAILEERGMKPNELYSILPKSRVSEILSGKRSISKAQAKQLAEHLKVPIELLV
jgi:HTH-type transcriptional regulator/antitoxin HigA